MCILDSVLLRICHFLCIFACVAFAQRATVLLTIADENGVAVSGAAVELRGPVTLRCTTDVAGHCRLQTVEGTFELTVAKPGFYQASMRDVRPSDLRELRVELSHTREIKQSVEVTASPQAIDPQQVATQRSVDNTEIVNIPFPVTRDIRQMLPYIPGVVRDRAGQIHVSGAETYQTLTLLDGFVISDPSTGLLNARFSTDAVRAIDVESSRYSAQYGPASGGVTAFTSVSGDDHRRFSATNFVPSVKMQNGLHIDKVTPRATFSGPLVKGRAWFLLAPEGEYDNNIVNELPPGQNRNPVWRGSNLAKLQVNVTPKNIVMASLLVNGLTSKYGGVSPFTPIETTLKEAHSSYIASVRDQMYLSGGAMIEAAVAVSRYHDRLLPLGTLPFVISPGIAHGNYYRSDWADSSRVEPQLNVYLPRYHRWGTHEIKFGAVARNSEATQTITRTPISILRADQTLYSRIIFDNAPRWTLSDAVYGGYVEDRWSPMPRLLIEAGIRADRDTAIEEATLSPRVAATYMLDPLTKISAGIGLFHDYPTLAILALARQGTRTQFVYDATGSVVVSQPSTTSIAPPVSELHSPSSRNWSVGIERQIARQLFVSADYIDRHTTNDFAYEFQPLTAVANELRLGNGRTTQYRALQLTARRTFGEGHELMLAYTRSTAHANAVLNYSLDSPVFSPQSGGPLGWDAPNKIVSWGFLPVPRFTKWSFGYSAEWHTGFPYSVFNQYQQLVGPANSRRFSDYVMINPFLEWRFSLKRYNLALRGGFENITNSKNPAIVQNNIDSPDFGRYAVTARRAFTARIRFLGTK